MLDNFTGLGLNYRTHDNLGVKNFESIENTSSHDSVGNKNKIHL